MNANGNDAEVSTNLLAALARCQPTAPAGSLKYYRTRKILDKSIKTGVTCASVFVGACNILYMKFLRMANNVG
jgi:hypothetical protein